MRPPTAKYRIWSQMISGGLIWTLNLGGLCSSMTPMGRPQTKNPREDSALVLNEELKRAAHAVVQSYDALPWDELNEYGLTNIRLSFFEHDGFQKAKEVLAFIAGSYPDLVEIVTRRFEEILSQKLIPVLDHGSLVVAQAGEIADPQGLRRALARFNRMVTRYREVLEQFRPPGRRAVSPKRTSEQWVALNECLEAMQPVRQSLLDLLREVKTVGNSGPSFRHELNLPIEPVWIAPFSDDWIDVPLSVFLADKIVALCRQIADVNTGVAQFPTTPVLCALAKSYDSLLNQCGLSGFHLPYEDVCPARMGKFMEEAVKSTFDALSKILKHLAPRPPAAQSEKTQTRDEKTRSIADPEAAAKSVFPVMEKLAQPAPASEPETDKAEPAPLIISVQRDGQVLLGARPVPMGSKVHRILLILALLSRRQQTNSPVVDRNPFLNQYGSKEKKKETAFYKVFNHLAKELGFWPLEKGRLRRKLSGLRFENVLDEPELEKLIRDLKPRRTRR